MLDWITHLLNPLGYPAIVLLMSVENMFPSELVMPLAGFTATQGELSLAGVIIAGTLGAILNALPPYFEKFWPKPVFASKKVGLETVV